MPEQQIALHFGDGAVGRLQVAAILQGKGAPDQHRIARAERLRQRHASIAVRQRDARHGHGGFVISGRLRRRSKGSGEDRDPSEERSGDGQAGARVIEPSHEGCCYSENGETATLIGEMKII